MAWVLIMIELLWVVVVELSLVVEKKWILVVIENLCFEKIAFKQFHNLFKCRETSVFDVLESQVMPWIIFDEWGT